MKRLLLFAATAFVALSGFAQEQPRFGEKVDVNLVLLDATVTDRGGSQILGLTKDDFVVKENGVAQKIESVEYFTNRTLLNAPESQAPFQVERTSEPRYFVLFFDRPTSGELWDRVTRARRDSMEFVKSLRSGDQVAIVGHDMRLKIYTDFTSDKAQLLHALDQLSGFPRGLSNGNGPIMRGLKEDFLSDHTGTVYEALETLADAMRSVKARKNMILFSPGMFEPGQDIRAGMLITQSRFYDGMIRALNSANVTIYAANLIDSINAPPVVHQTLQRVSDETNGEYFRSALSFSSVFKRVDQATAGYYLITYYAHHDAGDRGYQHVSVSLNNHRGLRVHARDGYLYGYRERE